MVECYTAHTNIHYSNCAVKCKDLVFFKLIWHYIDVVDKGVTFLPHPVCVLCSTDGDDERKRQAATAIRPVSGADRFTQLSLIVVLAASTSGQDGRYQSVLNSTLFRWTTAAKWTEATQSADQRRAMYQLHYFFPNTITNYRFRLFNRPGFSMLFQLNRVPRKLTVSNGELLMKDFLCRDYNCDSTTIRLRSDYDVSRAPASIQSTSFDASKKWTCQFFVVVVS